MSLKKDSQKATHINTMKMIRCTVIATILIMVWMCLMPEACVAGKILTVDGIVYSVEEATASAAVAGASGNDGEVAKDLVIPAYICHDGVNYAVREIAEDAFDGCVSIESLTVGASVEQIEPGAFAGCRSLRSVSLPDALMILGEGAFRGCGALESVSFGRGLSVVEREAFAECAMLRSVDLPPALRSLGEGSFRGCVSLEDAGLICASVIGEGCFEGCVELNSIILDTDLNTIGRGAFRGCRALTEIYLPGDLEEVGDEAFAGCVSVASVTLEDGLMPLSFGHDSFSNVSPSEVYLGRDLICDGSPFSGNALLTRLTIGTLVNELSARTFAGCDLTQITVETHTPPMAPEGMDSPFSNYDARLTVPYASASLYAEAPVWRLFRNVTLSVSQTAEDKALAMIDGANVSSGKINAEYGAVVTALRNVDIHTLDGILLARLQPTGTYSFPASGIYILTE